MANHPNRSKEESPINVHEREIYWAARNAGPDTHDTGLQAVIEDQQYRSMTSDEQAEYDLQRVRAAEFN